MTVGTFTDIGVHVADNWGVRVCAYPDTPPILVLRAETATVNVSLRDRLINENTLTFARQLAEQSARFAAEVERLHAEKLAKASGVCSGCGGPTGHGLTD